MTTAFRHAAGTAQKLGAFPTGHAELAARRTRSGLKNRMDAALFATACGLLNRLVRRAG